MSDSDDDMPPPLEDMSAQVLAMQAKKQTQQPTSSRSPATGAQSAAAQSNSNQEEDEDGFTRLVPKAKPENTQQTPAPSIKNASQQPTQQAKKPLVQEIKPTATASAAAA